MNTHEQPQGMVPVEYDPTIADRFAGMVGRVGLRLHGGLEVAEPTELVPPTNYLLHEVSSRGLMGIALDPESLPAQRLVSSFAQAPQFDKPVFIKGGLQGEQRRVLTIDATPSHPVNLPLRNFVSAPGMQDWSKGRDGYKEGRRSGSSQSVIRANARSGKPMKPIDGIVVAQVQPDGQLFLSAIQDGGHRIAAEHRRKSPFIPIGGRIIVNQMKYNVMPPIDNKQF